MQFPSTSAETYEGILTDTLCGAKHSAKVNLSAGDCARACAHAGEHFALVDGEQTYILHGESELLKRVAGERVKVSGTRRGGTIEVTAVAEADSRTE